MKNGSNLRLAVAIAVFALSLLASSFLIGAPEAEAQSCWICVSVDICDSWFGGANICSVKCPSGPSSCSCTMYGGNCGFW